MKATSRQPIFTIFQRISLLFFVVNFKLALACYNANVSLTWHLSGISHVISLCMCILGLVYLFVYVFTALLLRAWSLKRFTESIPLIFRGKNIRTISKYKSIQEACLLSYFLFLSGYGKMFIQVFDWVKIYLVDILKGSID